MWFPNICPLCFLQNRNSKMSRSMQRDRDTRLSVVTLRHAAVRVYAMLRTHAWCDSVHNLFFAMARRRGLLAIDIPSVR